MPTFEFEKVDTPMEREVASELEEIATAYEEGLEGVLQDLSLSGCSGGMIGSLIYYVDTIAFYKRHEDEIDEYVAKFNFDSGLPINQMFKGWDDKDPFARGTINRNILAWFGFEECAWVLAHKNGIEFWR